MSDGSKKSLDRRLARLEGQVRGIRRMIEEDVYCIDVLTQISAARSAIDQIAAELATGHVQTCILGHGTDTMHDNCSTMSKAELLNELRTTLSRMMR